MMFFKKKSKKQEFSYQPELHHLSYSGNSDLKNYLKIYQAEKGRLLWALFFWILKTSPDWVLPVVTADVINMISNPPENMEKKLLFYVIAATFVILQHIPTEVVFSRLSSKVNRSVEMRLRSSLCQRLQQLSIPFHKNNKMGILQTKILRDVENLQGLTYNILGNIPFVVITLAISITVTARRAPGFLLFFLVMIPIVVVIHKLSIKKIIAFNHDFRVGVESMSGRVIEMLRMITVTRAHNVENFEMKRLEEKFKQVADTGLRVDTLNAVYSAINWTNFTLFNTLTLITAGFCKYKGYLDLGVGDVVLLTTYFNSISHMILLLLNLFPSIMRGMESVHSIADVLECPDIERNEGKPAVEDVIGDFQFDKVGFKYDGESKPALKNISLDIRPGEIVAFVGPSGSGKSTMIQLLIGFMRPTEGRIKLDGRDMNDIDLRSYRRFISVVSQESVLFDGTIRENITYGVENIPEERIMEAIRCAGLDEFIKSLPEGLDTVCKENGNRFSGGQKQRMSIARALLRDPRVLLLDEATSALDVESEVMIQNALDHLVQGRTTLIVAHRLSTIRNANRIVVLNHGEIAEIGSHEELLAMKGIYYRMNLLQSKEISTQEAAEIGKALENF